MEKITQKEIMIAWSKGATLQVFDKGIWKDTLIPIFFGKKIYRIKEKQKEDIIRYASIGTWNKRIFYIHKYKDEHSQIELIFDGETNVLKDVKKL